jgi:hypothetical protein
MRMAARALFARTGGRRPTWRWGVSAIAVLCLLGQTATLADRMLVQHATCAEHGESVHVAAGAGVSSGPARGAEKPALAAAVVEEGEQHEHCAAAHTRSATPQLVPEGIVGQLSPGQVDLPARDAVPTPAVAAYVIAPKTSPPRTAS